MILALVNITALPYITSAFSGLQTLPGFNMTAFATQFSLFFPDLAMLMIVVMVAESWVLSFFLKAHPLSAILGIFSLFLYVIVSLYVSNALVMIAREPVFAPIVSSANLLFFFWINMPVILVVCAVIDIGVALTAYRAG